MTHLGLRFDDIKLRARDLSVRSADETVVLAGQLSHRASRESRLRTLAARITDRLIRVDVNGSAEIARFVRRSIRYRMETPGVEILQGPFTTLQTKVGDCDDLVILWVALCRSIGIDATFAGIRQKGATDYIHAIGYLPNERTFVELTDDRIYGGKRQPLLYGKLPPGLEALYWSPLDGRLLPAEGGGAGFKQGALRLIDRPGFGAVATLSALAFLYWRS